MRELYLSTVVILAAILAVLAAESSGGSDEAGPIFIEFGVSAAPWAGNGLCDDPRFRNVEGTADSRMTARPPPDALLQDAGDCRAAFEDGGIIPRVKFGDVEFAGEPQYTGGGGAKFRYAGDCSDPQLEGPGVLSDPASTATDRASDRGKTPPRTAATERGNRGGAGGDEQNGDDTGNDTFPLACRIPFLSGAAILKAKTGNDPFYYGHDGGRFAHDGECDDPRFEGAGMASTTTRLNVGRDATDCTGDRVKPTETVLTGQGSIDFGNNASRFSYDGECDDPRFEGAGMADTLLPPDTGKDAIDCLRAYNNKTIELTAQE